MSKSPTTHKQKTKGTNAKKKIKNFFYSIVFTKSNTIQLVSSPTGNRTQPKRLEGACAIHYTIGPRLQLK